MLAAIGQFVQDVIASLGQWGVALLMGVESCGIPLPSEVILPFSGSLVAAGRFGYWATVASSTIGCVVGSLPLYALGRYVGRDVILKYGRYVLLTRHEVELCDRLFQRFGWWATFFGRLLPGIRTYIALPAGVSRMPLLPFVVASAVGSWLWSMLLVWVGVKTGEHWHELGPWFHRFDAVILAVIVALGVWFLWHRLRTLRDERRMEKRRSGG